LSEYCRWNRDGGFFHALGKAREIFDREASQLEASLATGNRQLFPLDRVLEVHFILIDNPKDVRQESSWHER
jgi:hypothetical protein